MTTVFTIGHSNHAIEAFVALLRKAGIARIADVRSIPHSRFCPQFRREPFAAALSAAGIGYVWHGAALGGKPRDPALARSGKPDYAAMAERPEFRADIAKVFEDAKVRPTALMCAERDPLDCHRFHLLSAPLAELGADLIHVHADGALESHASAEVRLARRNPQGCLFG